MEAYLAGTLEPNEHDAFAARMQNEPALQEARLLITGIMESSLTAKLESFHGSGTGKVRSIGPRRMRTWQMAAAASVIIIAASAIFLWKGNDDKLMADYFEPDPGLVTSMGSTDNYAFNRGMVDYKSGKYNEAIAAWRPLIAANPTNDTLHYFSGVSFLALHRSDSAQHHLLQVANNTGSSFHSDANWYLALALLDQDKKAEARSFLEKSNHPKKAALLSRIQ